MIKQSIGAVLRSCNVQGFIPRLARGLAVPVRKRSVPNRPLALNFDLYDQMTFKDEEPQEDLLEEITSASKSIRRTKSSVQTILDKRGLETTVEEETLLELIKDLSPMPVPISDMRYVEFSQLPLSYKTPREPKNWDEVTINEYLKTITSNTYHHSVQGSVISKVMKLVNSKASLITKENYVRIVSMFHCMLKSNVCFEVLERMNQETEIVEDSDFLNAFIMAQNSQSVYKFRIKRLENCRDRHKKVNANTWYYLFNLFESSGSKLKLLGMMMEYEIPLEPIFNEGVSKLAEELDPEELTELYTQCKVQMNSFLFNTIIRSFLNNDRIEDAWKLINDKSSVDLMDKESFIVFIEYFLERNQLGVCFAFAKLWHTLTNENNELILKQYLLNEYLTQCEYFDNWSNMVKICKILDTPIVNGKVKMVQVNKRTIWAIKDYAIVHNQPNPSQNLNSSAKELRARIQKDLVWHDNNPIFDIDQNNKRFRETCKVLGG